MGSSSAPYIVQSTSDTPPWAALLSVALWTKSMRAKCMNGPPMLACAAALAKGTHRRDEVARAERPAGPAGRWEPCQRRARPLARQWRPSPRRSAKRPLALPVRVVNAKRPPPPPPSPPSRRGAGPGSGTRPTAPVAVRRGALLSLPVGARRVGGAAQFPRPSSRGRQGMSSLRVLPDSKGTE